MGVNIHAFVVRKKESPLIFAAFNDIIGLLISIYQKPLVGCLVLVRLAFADVGRIFYIVNAIL